MAYSRQGAAITGRRQYSPLMTGRPPYYPMQPEVIPEIPQGIEPIIQPVFAPRPRPLSPGPPGDMDISQGMAEGQTNVDAMPGGRGFQDAGQHAEKGEYGQAALDTGKGMLGMVMAPAMAPYSIAKPAIDWSINKIKGLFSSDDPTSGSAVGSGIGISGLSGPMGLANVEGQIAANPQGLSPGYGENQGFSSSEGPLGMDVGVGTQGPMGFAQAQDLADLDIGDFGGGDDGLGMGPSTGPGGPDGGGGYGF